VVVWIEILGKEARRNRPEVTTCVVVWIEIKSVPLIASSSFCHHLRGGVD